MNEQRVTDNTSQQPQPAESQPRQIRLPVFIGDEPIGLGDVIKHATSAVGLRPCGSCEERATALNRWVVFTGRRTQ